jgi:hypothetical protein
MAGGGATVDVRVKPEAAENEQQRTQTIFFPGEPLWPFDAFLFYERRGKAENRSFGGCVCAECRQIRLAPVCLVSL